MSFREQFAGIASQICEKGGVTIFLDYLCGKAPIMTSLKVGHNMKVQCYDPKVERFKAAPLAAQMVFCALEKEELQDTDLADMLVELDLLTGAVLFLAVGESSRTPEEWISLVVDRFELQTFQRVDGGFYMILYPIVGKVLAS